MKKIIVLLLAIILSFPVEAELKNGKCGENLTYTFDTNTGILKIEGSGAMVHSGGMYDFDANDLPWSSYSDSILEVVLPEGLTIIGAYAFYGCSNLVHISFPQSVKRISPYAFYGCSGLTSLTIPGTLKSIGRNAFEGCTGLLTLNLSEGVMEIDEWAFESCSGISTLTIPGTVKEIGICAFDRCSGLTSVIIHEGCCRIQLHAFSECSSMTSLKLPHTIESIGGYAFALCQSLLSVTIPASVKFLGEGAFAWCRKLASVTLSNNLEELDNQPSDSCLNDDVPFCYQNVFQGVNLNDATLYIPEGFVNYCNTHSPWNCFGSLQTVGNNDATDMTCNVWQAGSEWEVYYTDEVPDPDCESYVSYRLLPAQDDYLALYKTLITNSDTISSYLQGYIRSEGDSIIYVRPVVDNDSIGDECLLYDFTENFEYGKFLRYGVRGGTVKELYIDWQFDSLDYFMLNVGERSCLPAWMGIVYKYGYLGGPMELFNGMAVPSKHPKPKPTNISHVIFSTKNTKKTRGIDIDDSGDVIVNYVPMLDEGKSWEMCSVSVLNPEDQKHYCIRMGEVIQVGTRCCTRLYSSDNNFHMIVFEEGRKLYLVDDGGNAEVLLDYSLNKNDHIYSESGAVAEVTQIQNDNEYRTLTINTGIDCYSYFNSDTEPWVYYLIEGIGVSKDQFLPHRFLPDHNSISYLLRCWKDGSLLYESKSIVDAINLLHPQPDEALFDLQGRNLKSTPNKGIYLQTGRKIIR